MFEGMDLEVGGQAADDSRQWPWQSVLVSAAPMAGAPGQCYGLKGQVSGTVLFQQSPCPVSPAHRAGRQIQQLSQGAAKC